jgi:hypothetical protein
LGLGRARQVVIKDWVLRKKGGNQNADSKEWNENLFWKCK